MATKQRTPTGQPLSERAARMRLAITRTARRLRQEAGSDLGPSAAAALATIERLGPLSPSELAAAERIQRPTATRVIARLEEAGLVDRTPDPGDARCALISIRTEGTALLGRLRGRKTAWLARRLESLDAEEVDALERAAGILERMLEQERR